MNSPEAGQSRDRHIVYNKDDDTSQRDGLFNNGLGKMKEACRKKIVKSLPHTIL